jgi:hypothetical protein
MSDNSMLRSMVVSSTTAIVFGLTSASLGALTLGSAAIPFIIVRQSIEGFNGREPQRDLCLEHTHIIDNVLLRVRLF